MALEIIGSGFGRTGTMSLKRALDQLGFGPCHHMEEVFAHPEQVPHWQALAAGGAADWDAVFAGYRSQVDWPGAHYWRELAGAYPDAKVIHTARPEELWWNSFSGTIGVLLAGDRDIPLPPHVREMLGVGVEIIGARTFGGAFADREAALAAYRRRTAEVRAALPPDRLLVFDVADGWAPVCRFLGTAAPATPFPRVNAYDEWWKLVKGQPR